MEFLERRSNSSQLNNEGDSPPKPQVIYSENYNYKDRDFEIFVDAEKCGELLLSHNVPASDVSDLNIIFSRKARRSRMMTLSTPRAAYNTSENQIYLYADTIFKYTAYDREYINEQYENSYLPLSNASIGIIHKMNELVSLAGLEGISSKPSQYSLEEFRIKMQEFAKGDINKILLHELQHVIDAKTTSRSGFAKRLDYVPVILPTIAAFTTVSILTSPTIGSLATLPVTLASIRLNYKYGQLENRARTFADEMNNDPQWQNLIYIAPRDKNTV